MEMFPEAPSHLLPPPPYLAVPSPVPPRTRCSRLFPLKAPSCCILVSPKHLATTTLWTGTADTGWSGERRRPCLRLQVCNGSQDAILGEDHEFWGFLGVLSHVWAPAHGFSQGEMFLSCCSERAGGSSVCEAKKCVERRQPWPLLPK